LPYKQASFAVYTDLFCRTNRPLLSYKLVSFAIQIGLFCHMNRSLVTLFFYHSIPWGGECQIVFVPLLFYHRGTVGRGMSYFDWYGQLKDAQVHTECVLLL